MTGKAIVEPLLCEGTAGGNKAFLAVLTLGLDVIEFGQFGEDQPLLLRLLGQKYHGKTNQVRPDFAMASKSSNAATLRRHFKSERATLGAIVKQSCPISASDTIWSGERNDATRTEQGFSHPLFICAIVAR